MHGENIKCFTKTNYMYLVLLCYYFSLSVNNDPLKAIQVLVPADS